MRRFYYLFRAMMWLFLTFGRAAWHFRYRAMHSLDLPAGLALSTQEHCRLKHYFYGTTYLAAVMCCLRNQPRSPREKHLFTNLAALACCFDDLVDSFREGEDSSILWQDNPEAYALVADQRGLALHWLHNIYRTLSELHLGQFRAYMHRVFNVETGGRQRTGYGDNLPDGSQVGILEKITAEKGGASVLLFRSVLGHPLSSAEEDALSQFGYLIQLSDDIFDLWHDRQAGIVTLPTFLAERSEIALLEKIFERQLAATQAAFRQTPYPSGQVETALLTLHFLSSITRVCLQRYLNLENKFGMIPLDNRTAIVVDMGNWANRFRTIRHLLRPVP